MSFGFDATATLQPLNFTSSFLNPTASAAANLAAVNAANQQVLDPIFQNFGKQTDYWSLLAANQLSGLTPNTFNMSNEGTGQTMLPPPGTFKPFFEGPEDPYTKHLEDWIGGAFPSGTVNSSPLPDIGAGAPVSFNVPAQQYLRNNPDVAATVGNQDPTQVAMQHYTQFGLGEGRAGLGLPGDPHAATAATRYFQDNPDVFEAVKGQDPVQAAMRHYQQFGFFEGRNPEGLLGSPAEQYLLANPDVLQATKAAGLSRDELERFALGHWLGFGQNEGRTSYGLPQIAGLEGIDLSGDRKNAIAARLMQHDPNLPDVFGGYEGLPGSRHGELSPETFKPYTFGRPEADPVTAAINDTYRIAGMSPTEWAAIAQIESSMIPESNRNQATQYKGLYQLGIGTGESQEWPIWGMGDIYNPMDNAHTAARIFQDNAEWFKNTYSGNPTHRDPTAAELYLMHNQGRGFFTNGTLTNIAGNRKPGFTSTEQTTPATFLADYTRYINNLAAKYTK